MNLSSYTATLVFRQRFYRSPSGAAPGKIWWIRPALLRLPPACKAGALLIELRTRVRKFGGPSQIRTGASSMRTRRSPADPMGPYADDLGQGYAIVRSCTSSSGLRRRALLHQSLGPVGFRQAREQWRLIPLSGSGERSNLDPAVRNISKWTMDPARNRSRTDQSRP